MMGGSQSRLVADCRHDPGGNRQIDAGDRHQSVDRGIFAAREPWKTRCTPPILGKDVELNAIKSDRSCTLKIF
jgi:hypothetical protein